MIPMATATAKKKKWVYLEIMHDDCPDSPVNDINGKTASFDSEFTLVSFDMRSIFDGQLPDLDPDDVFKSWWPLSCYQHGNSHWSIRGQGTMCRWDTTVNAGVLYLANNNPGDFDDATKAAESVLAEFNSWCNGDCWGYRLSYQKQVTESGTCPCCHTENATWDDSYEEEIVNLYGFIGSDYIAEDIAAEIDAAFKMYNLSKAEYALSVKAHAGFYIGPLKARLEEECYNFEVLGE